jgi:hypothetical protein
MELLINKIIKIKYINYKGIKVINLPADMGGYRGVRELVVL